MHLRHFLQLAGATAIAGCSASSPGKKPVPQPFASLPENDQEVYDAVFRYQISRWAGSSYKQWYLKLLGHDAPPDLLQRYKAEGLEVYPRSSYMEGSGVVLSISRIVSLTTSHAELAGGYAYGSLAAAFGKYHLVKKQGRWIVASFTVEICA